MSINSEISRLAGAKTSLTNKMDTAGYTGLTGKKIDQLVDMLDLSSGGSSWTLLGSKEQAVTTTSTSASSATTISIGSAAWTHSKIIYVRIRDKAGPRAGYFYGSDTFFINVQSANGSKSQCTNAARFIHRYTTSTSGEPTWSQTAYTSTTGYGVYAYGITAAGAVKIYRRYNSSNSLTINGTYVIEVYSLDYPDGIGPYDA